MIMLYVTRLHKIVDAHDSLHFELINTTTEIIVGVVYILTKQFEENDVTYTKKLRFS